jgi:hypothetical protein
MADGDPIVLGGANGSSGMTSVSRSGTASNTAFVVSNDNGSAVEGDATFAGDRSDTVGGVIGRADSGDGVQGRSVSGRGVYGQSDDYISVQGDSQQRLAVGGYTQDGRGVFGGADGTGNGVVGFANRGYGVTGFSERSTGVHGVTRGGLGSIGVRGDADVTVGVWGSGGQAGVIGSGSGSGVGVQAYTQAGSGVGVQADSGSNDAVVGTSIGARGVVGTTLSPTGTGVHGVATSGGPTQVAVQASASTGLGLLASCTTGTAGAFFGPVVVVGNFVASGGVKSAAVAHPDGTHRLTYCMESPESWFEDFGRARLSGGRAEVRLDPDFAVLVRTDDFHVFLTAEGETAGLYVADRSDTGFEVREQRGGDGEVAFSYRVVARRRDVDAGRLATFDLPEIPPEPEAIAPPELPELPEQPALAPEWPPLPWQQSES